MAKLIKAMIDIRFRSGSQLTSSMKQTAKRAPPSQAATEASYRTASARPCRRAPASLPAEPASQWAAATRARRAATSIGAGDNFAQMFEKKNRN